MFIISTPTSHKRRQYFISLLETNHPSADIYLLMNHKRAQYTKSNPKRMSFLVPSSATVLGGRLAQPQPSPPSSAASPGWHVAGTSPLCSPPFTGLRPSAAPGVLRRSGSNPANLHDDEASSAGWVLRGLGRNMPCPLERGTEGSAMPRRIGAPGRWVGVARQGQHPPRTAQLYCLLSLCPAGPAEERPAQGLKQQEVRYECQLQTQPRQAQVRVTGTYRLTDLEQSRTSLHLRSGKTGAQTGWQDQERQR